METRAASTRASFGRASQAAKRREIELQKQIESLSARLEASLADESVESRLEELQQRLNSVLEEQSRLLDKAAEQAADHDEQVRKDLAESVAVLNAEIEALEARQSDAVTANGQAVESRLEELQQRIESLKEETNSRVQEAMKDLNQRLAGMEDKAESGARALDTAKQEFEDSMKALRQGLEQRMFAEIDEYAKGTTSELIARLDAIEAAQTQGDEAYKASLDALRDELQSQLGSVKEETDTRVQEAMKDLTGRLTGVEGKAVAADNKADASADALRAAKEEVEALREASGETSETLQKSIQGVSSRLKKAEDHSVSLHVTSALRALRPLWTGGSAVEALKSQAEVEHGHELMMAVLADEEKASPGALAGKTLIEIGTTRENVPAQGSTQKLGVFAALTGMRFVTVDMDPENTKAASEILRYINPGAQAVTKKGEIYLRQHVAPLEYIYLDAFDFDHGKHSEARQSRYRKYLGTEISDPACWKMHEDCAETIIARMVQGGIVVLDDTWTDEEGRYAGKGKLAMPLLMDNGFTVIARMRKALALRRGVE